MSHSINRVLVFAVTVLVGFLAAGRSFAGAPDYIIDLAAAVPFACAAAYLARLHFKLAAVHLAAVLAWLFAIRFATPAMAAHPYVLRALGEAAELGGIVLDGWKRGKGIPESVGGFVGIDGGHAAIGGARGHAAVHVISPIDLARAQKLGDLGEGKRHRLDLAGADVFAALRRQHIQVGRQAVGGDGLKESVLENIEARVIPVVGKLAIVVPTHDVARLRGGTGDEAVHQPAVDTVQRVNPVVGSALVDDFGVVGGGDAGTAGRVGGADAGR